MGNGLIETDTTNTRLQMQNIQVGTSIANPSNVLSLSYGYGATSNNGNVLSQTITRGSQTFTQSYGYTDGMNRLNCVNETPSATAITCGTGSPNWSRVYGYDPWANGFVPSYIGLTPNSFTPVAPSNFDSTNHLLSASATYDGAGNQKAIGGYTFAYDAENRMTSSTVNSSTTTYVYDGNGNRVSKTMAGTTTTYVYDAMGQLIAEYGTPTDSGTKYITVDHLGSTRLVTDTAQNQTICYDYLPFGEQIPSTTDGRTGCYGSAATPLTQKFTGKERDAESGLDYFGARYFSSAQGRFTSADPKQFNAKFLANPQKWNKYAYTLNNPLALVDPDGKEEVTVTYRAFIPQSQVSIGGFTFRGDNRTFSTAGTASSRIAISVRVETDPSISSNPLIGTPQVSVGQTERISPFAAVATATSGLPTANVSRDANGNVVIQIDANAKNPLVPFPVSLVEPGIKPNLTVTIPTDASSATVTGQTSAFPAQEVNGTVGTATNPLFQFSPTSTNPIDLYKTVQVNQTKPLPQCTTDADGKKTCQ